MSFSRTELYRLARGVRWLSGASALGRQRVGRVSRLVRPKRSRSFATGVQQLTDFYDSKVLKQKAATRRKGVPGTKGRSIPITPKTIQTEPTTILPAFLICFSIGVILQVVKIACLI